MSDPAALDWSIRRFSVFELDRRARQLRKQGVLVRLQQQPIGILEMLLEHPGEVVTREQLQKKLWSGNVYIDFDHGLNNAITRLREALGDSAENPRFIETLPRVGYRFIAPVLDEPVVTAKPTPPASPVPAAVVTITPRRLPWVIGAVIAVIVALATGIAVWRHASAPVPIRSIAVLPLDSLSNEPAQDYFADGMTDSLITELAQLSSLRVTSRTSSLHYRNARVPLPQIARELQVDAIVEGTVLRDGDRIRVNAQLIRAADDRHLWAGSFEGDVTDLIALQRSLVRAIASAVEARLTSGEARLASKPKTNMEAYLAYSRGMHLWNQRNKEAVNKSIVYFQSAITADPGYAQAYAALAEAYCLLGGHSLVVAAPATLVGPKALAAAQQAVALDPELAESHAALGRAIDSFELATAENRQRVEAEYQRALELNPSLATAHLWLGNFLLDQGRVPESEEQFRLALSLDPLSPNTNGAYGESLIEMGRLEEGMAQLLRTVELDPWQYNSRMRLGMAYADQRRFSEAIAEFTKAEQISPNSLTSLALLGHAQALAGDGTAALATVAKLEPLAEELDRPGAVVYVEQVLQRREETLQWLEKAIKHQDSSFLDWDSAELAWLKPDPKFQALRSQANSKPRPS